MLVVKVELHSAKTRMVYDLARAEIQNIGLVHQKDFFDYKTKCFEFNGKHEGFRTGRSIHKQFDEPVLVMVARCIISAYEGDKK